jgi:hypothetical protein
MKIKQIFASAICGLVLVGAGGSAWAAGAVVVAPDNSDVFTSTNQTDANTAITAAMAACTTKFGVGCKLIQSYDTGCLGIARSDDMRHWGYAVRSSRRDARYAAIGNCSKFSSDCHVDSLVCEGGGD